MTVLWRCYCVAAADAAAVTDDENDGGGAVGDDDGGGGASLVHTCTFGPLQSCEADPLHCES